VAGFWRFTGLMDQFVGSEAKGDLAGTYPSPRVAALTETFGPTKLTIGRIDDGETLIRTGTNITSVAGGGGGPPTGAASGDLGGSYPGPSVAKLTTTGASAASLTIGSVLDTQFLVRSGATVIGSAGPAPSGAAGGQLSGTYPNPSVAGLTETSGPTALTVGAVPATGWLHRDGAANVVGSVQLFTPMVAIAVAGSNFNTNCALGNVFNLTLVTPTEILTAPTNGVEGATYLWHIDQNAGGTGILTYNAVFAFPGGTAPVMTTAAGSNLVLSAVLHGGVFWTTFSQDFA